eukprot:scaffold34678_cov248-Amphora_coffeaeformis.AAC.5
MHIKTSYMAERQAPEVPTAMDSETPCPSQSTFVMACYPDLFIPCLVDAHECKAMTSALCLVVGISGLCRHATGVEVADEVTSAFNDFKLQQGEKLRYIIFSIENKKTIVITEKGERSKSFDDFCGVLPDDDCRYGLVDLDFTTTDGRPTSKLVLITWNPDTASIRSKMLYSGSKEALKTALNGVGIHINATDRSELDFESSVLPACQKFA